MVHAQLAVNSGGYNGAVTITWQLQSGPSSWTNISSPVTTTVTLTGSTQYVYPSPDGSQTSNYNWGTDISTDGTYRVLITVNS